MNADEWRAVAARRCLTLKRSELLSAAPAFAIAS